MADVDVIAWKFCELVDALNVAGGTRGRQTREDPTPRTDYKSLLQRVCERCVSALGDEDRERLFQILEKMVDEL